MKIITTVAVVVVALASQLVLACPASTESPSARYENPKAQGATLTSYRSAKPIYTANSQSGAGADANVYAAPVVHKQRTRTSQNND